MLEYAFYWLLGVAIGNALIDVMAVMLFSSVRPTLFGVARAFLFVPFLYLPKKIRAANIYFAILTSWLCAAVAFVAIIVLFIVKNANNSNGTPTQQQ